MDDKVITTEVNEKARRTWHTPTLRVFRVADTLGDPASDDDGEGDGLS